ncbi:MAG: hypothetical protein ABI536_04795, partial [Gallionella sp.]
AFFAAGFFVAGVFDVAIFILHKNFRTFTTTHSIPKRSDFCEDACGIRTVSTFKKTCNKFRKKLLRKLQHHEMIFSPLYN